MKFFKMQVRTLLLAVVMVVGVVCVSNGDRPPALVGQWVFADGYRSSKVAEKSVELFSDGTGVVDGISVTWKVENKRLMLLSSFAGIAADYKVSGYELVLTYDNEESATFVKKGKLEEYKKKKAEKEAEEAEKEAEEAKKEAELAKKEAERIKKEAEQRYEKISSYFTDSRNGQKYRAVKIGGKTWMAENMNYQTGNSWCYGNDDSFCKVFGRLYDWNTAKVACPSGWHLPSRGEWNALVTAAGDGEAGKALKSLGGWIRNGNGTDNHGFSALPGGRRETDGEFSSDGSVGMWWTATEYNRGDAYYRYMDYYNDYAKEGYYREKSYGFSVRCIADD